MTFTYAVIADGGIVLAADSQVTYEHNDEHNVFGTYEGCRGKIKRIGTRFAFSIAGNGGVADELIASVDPSSIDKLASFEDVVQDYETTMRRKFLNLYSSGAPLSGFQVAFLFCGYNANGFPIKS
jgi:20S proteasome alpha/beta subunit